LKANHPGRAAHIANAGYLVGADQQGGGIGRVLVEHSLEVARRLGYPEAFSYSHPAQIFREHAALSGFENDGTRGFDISALAQISNDEYEHLEPLQWPLPAGTRTTARPFSDGRFYTDSKRARLIPIAERAPHHPVDAAYPLVLNTGRVRDQWHTMTRTGRSPASPRSSPSATGLLQRLPVHTKRISNTSPVWPTGPRPARAGAGATAPIGATRSERAEPKSAASRPGAISLIAAQGGAHDIGAHVTSTGIVRKIDELGRIVLPSELRKILGMRHGDELAISVEGDQVILEKRHDVCVFCSSEAAGLDFKGRRVCMRCASDVANARPLEIRLPDEANDIK
jgi:AbrB family looped-hinge helix DNA binding protein